MVSTAATHIGGAATAAAHAQFDLGTAPGEQRDDSYLLEARKTNPQMRMMVMLSDPLETASRVPLDAKKVAKPFTIGELRAAIKRATSVVTQTEGAIG